MWGIWSTWRLPLALLTSKMYVWDPGLLLDLKLKHYAVDTVVKGLRVVVSDRGKLLMEVENLRLSLLFWEQSWSLLQAGLGNLKLKTGLGTIQQLSTRYTILNGQILGNVIGTKFTKCTLAINMNIMEQRSQFSCEKCTRISWLASLYLRNYIFIN